MWKKTTRLLLRKRLSYIVSRNKSSERCQPASYSNIGGHNEVRYNGLVTGAEVEGFKVNRVAFIKDFNCHLIKLRHIDTGAEYVHIDRNDSNNVFAVAFRTTPFNSTGLPHILEHITLCGSKKYPCRDPFFKMLNRSLATFMNAMTGPDFTVYPFSTQNHADYYNLMSVYMDAVFRPQLKECDFRQEGWRLEHEDIYDPQSPIIFKGVVYNEMKGVFSENDSIFLENLLNNILPSHTYGFISGGDPLIIPQLTHRDLVEFHEHHYHPSNCKIYSYGNFNIYDHLKFVNTSYLQHYKNDAINYSERTIVPLEPRWNSSRRKHIYGRVDPLAPDPEKQSILAASYLCEDILKSEENFTLKVVSKLLTDGPNSSFYKSLIEADIGSGYAPGTGFESQTRDTSFTVGLQGIKSKDFNLVEEIISATLSDVVQEGFDEKNVENILHGIELNIKHQKSNFGLDLLFGITSLWNHDGDLIDALKISEYVSSFRKRINDNPRYLQQTVEQYFKCNNHHLVLTMSPDENYETSIKQKETECLQRKLSALSDEDKSRIYEDGLKLRAEQKKQEDLNILPTLQISDIKLTVPGDMFDEITYDNVPIQQCVLSTNGISYFNAVINTSCLDEELKSVLPLFGDVVSEMGTAKNDYRSFDQLVYMKTGGLHISTHLSEDLNNCDYFEEGINLSSHCLDRNVDGMFELWNEIIDDVTLNDLDRFSTLVRDLSSDLLTGIADSGHKYAMLSAASMLNPVDYRKERFSGLEYVFKIKQIAQMKDLSAVLEQMNSIKHAALQKRHLRCSINVSPETSNIAFPYLIETISRLPGKLEKPSIKTTINLNERITNNNNKNNKHYVFPFAVNYTATSLRAPSYNTPDYASLKILCRLLTNKYLLPLVREKYGAYGAGVTVSPGSIQFYSYRDPNSTATLDIFDGSADWIRKNEFTDKDIDEAKLGIFQTVDMPVPPCARGMRSFLYGITDDEFNAYRSNLINVNRESIFSVSDKYMTSENAAKVIVGPQNSDTLAWTRIE